MHAYYGIVYHPPSGREVEHACAQTVPSEVPHAHASQPGRSDDGTAAAYRGSRNCATARVNLWQSSTGSRRGLGLTHRLATSFGTTYGVACASCKWPALCQGATLTIFDVGGVLLREHER